MGHKVHPTGFRLGVIKGWDSRWYANRNYKDLLAEDRKLRELILKRLSNAAISRIEIERVAGTQISIAIHTAKPGIVIGKSGESVDRLRAQLENATKKKIRLNILEIRNPDVDANLVARSIADQIEKRVSFRRAMKQGVQKSMRAGAKGIRVVIGGRLGGAEIARTEKEAEGSVPLQTLRADIDYGLAEAHTTYGVIGVKVWIYHGDVLPDRARAQGLGGVQSTPAEVPQIGERVGAGRGDRRGGGDRGPRGGGPRSGGPGGARGGADRGPRGGARAGGVATGERRQTGQGGPGGAPRGSRSATTESGPTRAGAASGRRTTPEVTGSGPAAHEFPAPAPTAQPENTTPPATPEESGS